MDLLVKVAIDTDAVTAGIESMKQSLAGIESTTAIDPLTKAVDKLSASAVVGSEAMQGTATALTALTATASPAAQTLDADGVSAGNAADGLDGVANSGTDAATSLTAVSSSANTNTTALKSNRAATDNAVQGLAAAQAASGLLSGTLAGTASGVIALSGALKSLGVASAGSIALIAGLVAGTIALAKTVIDCAKNAEKLRDTVKFDNATSGIDNMRRAYERVMSTLDSTISLARELRGITAKSDDLGYEKKSAEMELRQKKELSSLDPTDVEGAKEMRSRHQMERANLDLDRTSGGIGSEAADAKKQLEENQKSIEERKKNLETTIRQAENASRNASKYSGEAAEIGASGYFGKPRLEQNVEASTKWTGISEKKNEEVLKIRSEIKELENKNTVLAEQAALYEKRNEIIAIRKEAAAIPEPEFAASQKDKDEKVKGEKVKGEKGQPLSVDSDRLARIGGFVGGSGGQGKLESLSEKQLAESKKTSAAVEKIARVSTGVATWG